VGLQHFVVRLLAMGEPVVVWVTFKDCNQLKDVRPGTIAHWRSDQLLRDWTGKHLEPCKHPTKAGSWNRVMGYFAFSTKYEFANWEPQVTAHLTTATLTTTMAIIPVHRECSFCRIRACLIAQSSRRFAELLAFELRVLGQILAFCFLIRHCVCAYKWKPVVPWCFAPVALGCVMRC